MPPGGWLQNMTLISSSFVLADMSLAKLKPHHLNCMVQKYFCYFMLFLCKTALAKDY